MLSAHHIITESPLHAVLGSFMLGITTRTSHVTFPKPTSLFSTLRSLLPTFSSSPPFFLTQMFSSQSLFGWCKSTVWDKDLGTGGLFQGLAQKWECRVKKTQERRWDQWRVRYWSDYNCWQLTFCPIGDTQESQICPSKGQQAGLLIHQLESPLPRS